MSLYSQLRERERELDAEWRADGVGPFNTRGSWQPLLTQEKFKKIKKGETERRDTTRVGSQESS